MCAEPALQSKHFTQHHTCSTVAGALCGKQLPALKVEPLGPGLLVDKTVDCK